MRSFALAAVLASGFVLGGGKTRAAEPFRAADSADFRKELRAFYPDWGQGSRLMQPNCNSVEELLDAQKHPERHWDRIVRACGFSARFISLSKRRQDEVIARHRLK